MGQEQMSVDEALEWVSSTARKLNDSYSPVYQRTGLGTETFPGIQDLIRNNGGIKFIMERTGLPSDLARPLLMGFADATAPKRLKDSYSTTQTALNSMHKAYEHQRLDSLLDPSP